MKQDVIRNEPKMQPVGAAEIVSRYYQGREVRSAARTNVPIGHMPAGTFLVCGECTDAGGGSSGQCR